MRSPPPGSGPSAARSPTVLEDTKVAKPQPMSKMSAIARAKAKRAKFLASGMDYSSLSTNTTNSSDTIACPDPGSSSPHEEVGSVAQSAGLSVFNQSNTTQAPTSTSHETSACEDDTEYAYGDQRGGYSGSYNDYVEEDDDDDGVAKSEAAFLASSRRKMVAALKGYDVVDDDDSDENGEQESSKSAIKKKKDSVLKSKTMCKSTITSTDRYPLKSTIRGHTPKTMTTMATKKKKMGKDAPSNRSYPKKRSASTLDEDSSDDYLKRAKAKLSGANNFKLHTAMPQNEAGTASEQKSKTLSDEKKTGVDEEDPWAWIKNFKR
ncbi:hypothetical protein BKA64DRAFT_701479 [Cadophora sp. MPI-SDFR-AT-0126]|nr:hypothetical protein BKA64DRAFT_701479 [Leotiomycetes sp. MPI-SDFR-AT-0126]